MSGPRYGVGQPVPMSASGTPKPLRRDLAFSKDLRYAHGTKRTSSGRLTTGMWALHATKGWRKRA